MPYRFLGAPRASGLGAAPAGGDGHGAALSRPRGASPTWPPDAGALLWEATPAAGGSDTRRQRPLCAAGGRAGTLLGGAGLRAGRNGAATPRRTAGRGRLRALAGGRGACTPRRNGRRGGRGGRGGHARVALGLRPGGTRGRGHGQSTAVCGMAAAILVPRPHACKQV